MDYEIISIDYSQKNLVEEFLRSAGSSLKKFRYFSSRPIVVLKNHIVTLIVLKEKKIVGYGHLDKENNSVWLGTAVIESEKGKGVGKMLMEKLFEEAKMKNVKEITLTVDNDNAAAISLYEKFGFHLLKKENEISFMKAEVK